MTDRDTALEQIKQDLLNLADFAFDRLARRLDGLTDAEYLWEPVPGCWSVRPDPTGAYRMDSGPADPPPLTTIAWRICHVIDTLAARRNATWLGVPIGRARRDGEPATATAATGELRRAYTRFRAHIAAVPASTLATEIGAVAGAYAGATRAAFVLHELDELIHHGAEVAALRDLYQAFHASGG